MRAVAAELGSAPMSIYRHVRDKDELLVLLLDRLASELPPPRLPRDPRKRVTAACLAMRDGLAAHPWVVQVLAGGDLIAPSILPLMEEIVAGFVACGLSHAQAADAYRAVWELTVGHLTVRRGLDHVATLDRPPFVLEVLTSVDAEELPTLAALAGQWSAARGRDTYEIALSALIDGLVRERVDSQGP